MAPVWPSPRKWSGAKKTSMEKKKERTEAAAAAHEPLSKPSMEKGTAAAAADCSWGRIAVEQHSACLPLPSLTPMPHEGPDPQHRVHKDLR